MDTTLMLKEKIRPANLFDEIDLEKFSHSKLEVFDTCPYQYKFKYEDKLKDDATSIALKLGSLSHEILEKKFYMIQENNVDYDVLFNMLNEGVELVKKEFFEDWYTPDPEGKTYDEKIIVFKDIIKTEMEEDMDDWKPYKAELEFNFVYDKYLFHGFIDRIDINNNGDLRTIDYKTSRKVFEDKKLATSQQFGIYALAMLAMYDKLPIESVYRFIYLDEKQYALTPGWEGRLIKKLDKMFAAIEDCKTSGIWKPSPKPLCHWCYACATNPNAGQHKRACDYYSNWTRENKDFSVNKVWTEEEALKNKRLEGRKLIF